MASPPLLSYLTTRTPSLGIGNTSVTTPTTASTAKSKYVATLTNSLPSNNGATSPVPTKITPPTTPTNSLSSPAAQNYVSSLLPASSFGSNAPGYQPDTLLNNGAAAKTPAQLAAAGAPADPTAPSTTTSSGSNPTSDYASAMADYIAALKNSQDLTASEQSQTLNANRQYQSDLDAPGGLQGGNQATAALDQRRNNASLADLGVAETSATNATNLAYNKVQALQPTQAPYTLSPGQTRYDASGNAIASAPDTTNENFTLSPGSARYSYDPTTGTYTQVANQPATGLAGGDVSQLTPYTKTAYDGSQYVDLSSLTATQKQAAAAIASANGIPTILDAQSASKINAISDAKTNLANIQDSLDTNALLGNQGIGAPAKGLENSFASLFGDDAVKSYNAWRTAIINNVQALAGGQGSGLRINQAEIDAAMQNDLPVITGHNADSIQSAAHKLAILNSQLDTWQTQLLGGGNTAATTAAGNANTGSGGLYDF